MSETNRPQEKGHRDEAEVRALYENSDEAGRLRAGIGRLEFLRTREIVQRHLPPAPAVVYDVGGGPGREMSLLSRTRSCAGIEICCGQQADGATLSTEAAQAIRSKQETCYFAFGGALSLKQSIAILQAPSGCLWRIVRNLPCPLMVWPPSFGVIE